MARTALPAGVKLLRKRIDYWRRTRDRRTPMPADLWHEAVALARSGRAYAVDRAPLSHRRAFPRHPPAPLEIPASNPRALSQIPVAIPAVAQPAYPRPIATPDGKEDPMLLGYARISTDDQKQDLQHDALRANGCDRIFDETASGAAPRLPVRDRLLDYARPGDAIVVWKLDRLGRSLRDLIDIVTRIGQRGVALRSLHESIDTATPAGKLTFHVFAALSEFERDVLRERTRAGLAAARTRGAKLGRPRALTPEQLEMARTLMANPNLSTRQVARQPGVHRATLCRNLADR